MSNQIHEDGKFKYFEDGEGEVILLLHGLFGALSNFGDLIDYFKKDYKVVLPVLPIYELPLKEVSLENYVKYVAEFVDHMGYDKFHVLGNSLGGHVGILYILQYPEKIKTATLTGSSGLFENAFGSTFPKRGDYEFIRQKTAATFYSPSTASKELVDEVYEIVNNRDKGIRIVVTAKSAIRHNVGDRLHTITAPVLLIWGMQDTVTPAFVGEDFHKLLPNSELHLIDKTGHAPMMEEAETFNAIFEAFLRKHA